MPESDPARESAIPGIREPKGHSPGAIAAPVAGIEDEGLAGLCHHQAPGFGRGVLGGAPDWAAVLDELPYGLVVLGPKQELRHENARCRQLTGWSVGEKGGVEAWLSALCPDAGHREKVIASWREHIWRNQLKRTFTLRTPDQKLREIEFRSSLLRDGGITLTLDDVTDLRRVEERSRHGQLKFRALFTHTRTGTVLVDPKGQIIDANPAFLAASGHAVNTLRLTPLVALLSRDDAAALARAERAWSEEGATARPLEREVSLSTRGGKRRMRLCSVPVGEVEAAPAMSLHLFEGLDSDGVAERLKNRLRVVSDKAQALLQAVPDLILLVDGEGIVSDFAPPPRPWRELALDDGWRHRPAGESWPALGDLLDQSRERVSVGGRTVHAEIGGPGGGGGGEFGATLSPCGDGQILVVVRNLSDRRAMRERDRWQGEAFARAPLAMLHLDARGRVAESNAAARALLGECGGGVAGAAFSEGALPPGTSAEVLALEENGASRGSIVFIRPASEVGRVAESGAPSIRERAQHGFRNQLQLVTSLFSLEPQGKAAQDAFLKWQVRLRSLALACPPDDAATVWVFPLVRALADEVCAVTGRGPGRREVVLTGAEDLSLDPQDAAPFSLLVGEWLRSALALRPLGGPSTPGLRLHLRRESGGGFAMIFGADPRRGGSFGGEGADLETLESLADQFRARLESCPDESGAWILAVPPAWP